MEDKDDIDSVVCAPTMEDVKKLRATTRRYVTNSGKALSEICEDPLSSELDVTMALELFESYVQKMDEAQSQYESLFKPDEQDALDAEIDDAFEQRKQRVFNVMRNARKRLSTFSAAVAFVRQEDDRASVISTSTTSGDVEAKLPKLELPSFHGVQREWTPWWQQFAVMVHKKANIPDVTKFAYLSSVLHGDAKSVIAGLSLTEENYPTAIELLTSRYGRPDREIFTHISDLLAVQVPDAPTVDQLYTLYHTLQSHIRSLDTLDISGEQYGVILTPLILSRLPDDLRMEWVRAGERKEREDARIAKSGGQQDDGAANAVRVGADLRFLMNFLKTEVQHRETSQTYARSSTGQLDASSSTPATAAALHTANSKKPRCVFCNMSNHTTSQCRSKRLSVKEKREKLFQNRICTRCLKGESSHPQGFTACTAKCSKCSKSHHSVLCPPSESSPSQSHSKQQSNTRRHKKPDNTQPSDSQSKPPSVDVTNATHSQSHTVNSSSSDQSAVLLQTLKVSVKGKRTAKAVILFDTGSDRTYVSQRLVDQVQPEWVEHRDTSFASFGSAQASALERRDVYNILLQGSGEQVSVNATCIPIICSPLSQPKLPVCLLPQLGDVVAVKEGQNIQIDMLIGLDHYWKIVNSGPKYLTPNLVAQDTTLGRLISGRVPSLNDAHKTQSSTLFCREISEKGLQSFWDLESVGINLDKEIEDPVVSQFHKEIKRDGDRYSVALPWKENTKVHLVNNKKSAMKRLENLQTRLEKDEDLKKGYSSVFTDMFEQGMIEEVPTEEIESTNPVFYLPHHPVIKNASTTTKVRPVFDASAKGYNGVSLNDCMHAGPNYLPDLPGLLMRFRRWKVALTADVTKAFLQVGVKKEDRDAHRFLWNDEGKIRTMRFTRVPFGNKASPFLLMATIKHHLSSVPPSIVVDELYDNTYMDDWLSGSDSETQAQEMFLSANEIMAKACMSLAKWNTNSEAVSKMFVNKTNDETQKVLGMKWSPSGDCFSFSGLAVQKDVCLTKRLVLSLISRLFDPLGFLTPFTITVKCIFQEIWKLDLGWDVILPETIQESVRKWLEDLDTIKTMNIPRRFSGSLWSETVQFQLHGFGDASEKAYGACVYVLKQNPQGEWESSLITSRAKVTPLKGMTLPRLELMGALLCARLMAYVFNALKLPNTTEKHFWTDSKVTLAWIQNKPHKWKTFVANRVSEIHSLSDPKQWHHIAGVVNPADLLTRGISAENLVNSQKDFWLQGPTALMKNANRYYSDQNESEDTECEARTNCALLTSDKDVNQEVIDVSRFNKLTKAIRVTALVLRFINNIKKKAIKQTGALTYSEQTKAKLVLLKEAQKRHYKKEISALKNKENLPKNSSLIKLSPFLGEDGLLRVQGRLQFAGLPGDTKHPIVVPKCHLAWLLAHFTHTTMRHVGVNSMLVAIRNTYWMIGARRICKDVKKRCLSCQRLDAQPYMQSMAPLPEERVNKAPPFSVIGIDHAGPLYCADHPGKKFYILLFTCAVVRTVHLELVDSMSCEDTLLALRRFIARRGMPCIIWSDNAKGFIAASTKLLDKHGPQGPDWKFIAPRSPWWGGFYERLIGVVKSCLKRTLGRHRLCRAELETLLHEVESCVNARPLTFVGDDFDSGKQLTPSHFLLGRGSPHTKVEIPSLDMNTSSEQLNCMFKENNELLQQFWVVWKEEYLRNLPPFKGQSKAEDIQIGSVVLIQGEGPRLDWPLGVIVDILQSKDNLTRTVLLKTAKGEIVRPVQRLHNLEIATNDEGWVNLNTNETTDPTSQAIKSSDSTQHPTSPLSSIPVLSPPIPDQKSKESTVSTRSGRIIKKRDILDM